MRGGDRPKNAHEEFPDVSVMPRSMPFGDVIASHPTPKSEKQIAAHPSLKPQAFLRAIVQAVLPLGRGVILDPFAGSGSTLAAANAMGYDSIGIEKDARYVTMARKAIPELAALTIK